MLGIDKLNYYRNIFYCLILKMNSVWLCPFHVRSNININPKYYIIEKLVKTSLFKKTKL